MNIPNILTLIRIFSIPIIIGTFYFDDVIFAHKLGAMLFLLASITDFLDGYFARKLNLQSDFGRMLDPIADKLLIGSILLMLVKFRKINEIPCLLILAREFTVSGLRQFLAQVRIKVPVSYLSKVKTIVQMSSLFIILLGNKGSGIKYLDILGVISLWAAAILTIVTGYSYCKSCIQYFYNKSCILDKK